MGNGGTTRLGRTHSRSRDAHTDLRRGANTRHRSNAPGVVHLSAECWPYARTGGMGEVVSTLARHQVSAGQCAAIVIPLYGLVRDAGYPVEPVGDRFDVRIGERVESVQIKRVMRTHDQTPEPSVFFVDHPDFAERPGIYGELGGDYPDNVRRFALFSAAALMALPRLAPAARVVHAHDWHAALALTYLRTTLQESREHRSLASVLSVHNAAFQGHAAPDAVREIGLPESLYDWRWLEWYGRTNLLKGGVAFADIVTTVSPTHASELRSELGGFGLDGSFRDLGDRLRGIVNGIDDRVWDPRTDVHLPASYSRENLSGKAACKAALQEAFGLPIRPDVPLLVVCARLTAQKGFDLLLESTLLSREHGQSRDVQVAILGEGEERYALALGERARTAPERVAVRLDFSDALEHLLMAGADMCLVPSVYEPCGLTQMRAQRYGAIPIAHRVGGLADTIDDGVSGVLFDPYTSHAFEEALDRALARFADPTAWRAMRRAAMNRDFGWAGSVRQYVDAYRAALARQGEIDRG